MQRSFVGYYCNYCKTFPVLDVWDNVTGTTYHCSVCNLPLAFEPAGIMEVEDLVKTYEEFYNELAGKIEVENQKDCGCGCHSCGKVENTMSVTVNYKGTHERVGELQAQASTIEKQIQELLEQAQQLVDMKISLEDTITKISGGYIG